MDIPKILFENTDIIVVDKPAGMPTHPSRLHQGDSLADALADYLSAPGQDFIFRSVNRLDRDTSGLVLIARTAEAAAHYNRLMRERRISREYEALVEDDGSLPGHGTIDAPIARACTADPHDISRCVDHTSGERAVTHYSVAERGQGYARVRFLLETGRTHQIRVHMAYIGHPIIGDHLYNSHAAPSELAKLRAVRITVGDDDGMMEFSAEPLSSEPLSSKPFSSKAFPAE